jgi:hypothetical protein
MTGEHPIYVRVSGHHLIQVLTATGQKNDNANIPHNVHCGIRVDLSKSYLAQLIENYHAERR